MTDFELPQSPEALRTYLIGQLEQWEQRARQVEQELNARRLAVMEEFERPLMQQSARLKALGLHHEAQQALELAEVVRQESRRLSGRLTSVSVPPDHPTPVADAPAQVADAPAPVADAPAPGPCDAGPGRPGGHVEDFPATGSGTQAPEQGEGLPTTGNVRRGITEEERARVDELFSQMEMLSAAAPEMDHEELKLRIELLGARGRLLQEEQPLLRGQNTRLGDRLHCMFGGLTMLAKKHLNPARIFVESLNQNKRRKWASFLESCEAEFQELLDRRRASEEKAAQQQLAQKRRQQADDETARHAALARGDLAELLEAPADAQDSYWQEDVREAVRDFHRLSPNQTESQLIAALRPFAELFETGGEFRWLRKKLNPKAKDSGSFEAVEVIPGVERPLVQPNTKAFDQWRGFLEGKHAAIVGASCRENRREQLQKFFGLSSLDWIENERTEAANTHTLDQRIRNGRYDMVFYLARFSSHSLQDCAKAACKASGVPFIVIERGYGIGAFCRAIERSQSLIRSEGSLS